MDESAGGQASRSWLRVSVIRSELVSLRLFRPVRSRTHCETSWATGVLVTLPVDSQFLGDGAFGVSSLWCWSGVGALKSFVRTGLFTACN